MKREENKRFSSENLFVSVVIPTCNRRDLIRKCVEALAGQTYKNMEVIVVDDGSTDDTLDVLRIISSDHPDLDLRVIENGKNLGANPSRNRGITLARGEVIAFLDSDCVAKPDWLERLMAGFTSDDIAAVTGLVTDPDPSNIWELAFKGTHRIWKSGPASRLIAGNMAIRKHLLLTHLLDEDYGFKEKVPSCASPDISTSGRSDEEGIFLKLRASGAKIMGETSAEVYHDHHYDRRSFFRQAYKGGSSAARLVYKFYLPHRLDLLPFIAAYCSIPVALTCPLLLPLPPIFFAGGIAAITYNDIRRKGKTPAETMISFPALFAYYQVRLFGYARQTLVLRTRPNEIRRERLDNKERERSVLTFLSKAVSLL